MAPIENRERIIEARNVRTMVRSVPDRRATGQSQLRASSVRAIMPFSPFLLRTNAS
jgi:hypothetical protein